MAGFFDAIIEGSFAQENNYKIKSAYLYGSFVKGSFKEESDIDVAIVLDNMKDKFSELYDLMRHRRQFDLRIEPHPFSSKEFNKNSNEFMRWAKGFLQISSKSQEYYGIHGIPRTQQN